MNDLRLISFDMDGTVLNSAKQMTEVTKEVMRAAADRGIILLPNTGRSLMALQSVLPKELQVRYISSLNGAVITDNKTGRDICRSYLSKSMIEQLWAVKGLLHCEICAVIRDYYYGENGIRHIPGIPICTGEAQERFAARIREKGLRSVLLSEDCFTEKLIMTFSCLEDKERAVSLLSLFPDLSVCYANKFNLEINASNVSKGRALQLIAGKLNISSEEILAIGDSDNDLSMLAQAGISVAMGNAEEKVKRVVSYITADNDADGAAMAIQKYCKL